MVIRCAHCQGTMRLDEKNIPDKPKVKVRCPHCSGIGYIENTSTPNPLPSLFDEQPVSQDEGPKFELPEPPTDNLEVGYDVSLPHDAFKDFRFPAEQDRQNNHRKTAIGLTSIGLKTIILVVASLVVIIFFALLVNIILPGPSGIQGVSRGGQSEEEETLTKTGGDIVPMKGSDSASPRRELKPK
jgi:predicted Zn finger-like uncharacterized protein